jgi:hypothetical protein
MTSFYEGQAANAAAKKHPSSDGDIGDNSHERCASDKIKIKAFFIKKKRGKEIEEELIGNNNKTIKHKHKRRAAVCHTNIAVFLRLDGRVEIAGVAAAAAVADSAHRPVHVAAAGAEPAPEGRAGRRQAAECGLDG